MPTLFFKLGFRFYFLSYDCREPVHVHVGNDLNKICKFWLRDGQALLADNSGFKKVELQKMGKIVEEHYVIN